MIHGDTRAGDQIMHAGVNAESGRPDVDARNAREPDPADGFPGGHVLRVQNMIKAMQQDRDPAIPGTAARKAAEIFLAVDESARGGKEVRVPLAIQGWMTGGCWRG